MSLEDSDLEEGEVSDSGNAAQTQRPPLFSTSTPGLPGNPAYAQQTPLQPQNIGQYSIPPSLPFPTAQSVVASSPADTSNLDSHGNIRTLATPANTTIAGTAAVTRPSRNHKPNRGGTARSKLATTTRGTPGWLSKQRTLAKNFVQRWTLEGFSFAQLVAEGINPGLLAEVYHDLGIPLLPEHVHSQIPVSQFQSISKQPLPAPTTVSQPQSRHEAMSPMLPALNILLSKKSAPAAETQGPNQIVLGSQHGPGPREDYRARLQAAKTKKPTDLQVDQWTAATLLEKSASTTSQSAEGTATSTFQTGSAGPISTTPEARSLNLKAGVAPSTSDLLAEAKRRAQTALARERIAMLARKQAAKVSQTNAAEEGASTNGRFEDNPPPGISDQELDHFIASSSAVSTPHTVLQAGTDASLLSASTPTGSQPRIPGLFMTAPVQSSSQKDPSRDKTAGQQSLQQQPQSERQESGQLGSDPSQQRSTGPSSSFAASEIEPIPRAKLSPQFSVIPSTLMHGSLQPTVPLSLRKRPVAADFMTVAGRASKRPFGQSHDGSENEAIIIEASDDETLCDESTESAPTNDSKRAQQQLTQMAVVGSPSRPSTATLFRRREVGDRELQILAMRKKIAEMELKRRLAKVGKQIMRQSSSLVPEVTSPPQNKNHTSKQKELVPVNTPPSPSAVEIDDPMSVAPGAPNIRAEGNLDIISLPSVNIQAPSTVDVTSGDNLPIAQPSWKLRRRDELQTNIPAMDASLALQAAKLEALRAQMKRLEEAMHRELDDKAKLVHELESLGIDTEGMNMTELEEVRNDLGAQAELVEAQASGKSNVVAPVEQLGSNAPGERPGTVAPSASPTTKQRESLPPSTDLDDDMDIMVTESHDDELDHDRDVPGGAQLASSIHLSDPHSPARVVESPALNVAPNDDGEDDDDVVMAEDTDTESGEVSSDDSDESSDVDYGYSNKRKLQDASTDTSPRPTLSQALSNAAPSQDLKGPEVDANTASPRKQDVESIEQREAFQEDTTSEDDGDVESSDEEGEIDPEEDDDYEPPELALDASQYNMSNPDPNGAMSRMDAANPSLADDAAVHPPLQAHETTSQALLPPKVDVDGHQPEIVHQTSEGHKAKAAGVVTTVDSQSEADSSETKGAVLRLEQSSLPNEINQPARRSVFQPYQSALASMKSYRASSESGISERAPSRLSNSDRDMDPNTPLCWAETTGGVCRDPACEYQHLEMPSKRNEKLLAQVGTYNPGRTPQEKTDYTNGLRRVLLALKEQKIVETQRVAKAVIDYQRQFLNSSARTGI